MGELLRLGKLQAQTNSRLDLSGGVANAGTISAGRELVVGTPADVDNRGGTLNGQRIEVSAVALTNRGGTIEQTGAPVLALNAGTVSNRDDGRIGIAVVATTDPGVNPGMGGGTGGSGDPDSGDGSGGTLGNTSRCRCRNL